MEGLRSAWGTPTAGGCIASMRAYDPYPAEWGHFESGRSAHAGLTPHAHLLARFSLARYLVIPPYYLLSSTRWLSCLRRYRYLEDGGTTSVGPAPLAFSYQSDNTHKTPARSFSPSL